MSAALQAGIARIHSASTGAIIGTGFLVSPRHVMTCAHVVNRALGRKDDTQEKPGPEQTVRVDFLFAREALSGLAGKVAEWRPMREAKAADIAVLQLPEPVGIRPYRLASEPPRPLHPFWSVGFPGKQDKGMNAQGKLGAVDALGRWIARGEGDVPGYFLEGGFSGAPVFDLNTHAVLGMASAALQNPDLKTAFIIPGE
jgi:hypothetical protein